MPGSPAIASYNIDMEIRNIRFVGLFLLMLLATPRLAFAQDIEPRRWTALPVGMNVAGVAYGYADGDIFFDPVLRIEDATVEIRTVGASYVHSFDWAGKTARFDIRMPFQSARWRGLLDGQPASASRDGLADPRFRLSVNLLGAPALKGKEFQEYHATRTTNTVVGAALAVTVPLGEYQKDKLLNLGENRFIIRPQMGFVHTRGPWSYELTGSVFIFTDNNDFLVSNKREQDPLYAIQGHVIRIFKPGLWTSLSAAYGVGGESKINGVRIDDTRSDSLVAVAAGFPIGRTQGVSLVYVRSRTRANTGADMNRLLLGWSIRY